MSDDSKPVTVRLAPDEMNRLQQVADAHHAGSLSGALRSLVATTTGDGDELMFRRRGLYA